MKVVPGAGDSVSDERTAAKAARDQPVVLIVDDHDDVLTLVRKVLAKRSFKILTATTAKQTLDLLKVHDVDLVLMDVMLPGVSGFDLCRTLRSHVLDEDVPVVFFTACSEPRHLLEGYQAGGAGYIVKSPDFDRLVFQVDQALERAEILPPRLEAG